MENIKNTSGLELEKIKEIWAGLALTAAARAKIEEAGPILAERQLQAALRETTESRQLLEKFGTPPLVSLEGMEQILLVAEKGDMLGPEQLEQAESALAAVKRMQDYLSRGQQYQIPLAFYGENLQPLEEIRQQIHQQIRGGQVEDHATRELFDLRSQIQRTQEKRKEKAESVLRTHRDCMSDSFCVTRGGHLCVPVKKEYKFRVSGSVIDKSATGNTLFIEPTAVQKYEEELSLLQIQEDNELRRILYTLTAMIGDQLEAFRENSRIMERLDYAFSKGKLSMEWDCAAPVVGTDRRIRLTAARHPLMDRRAAVPLDFTLGEELRGVVITGPNTGGKTVALKTVALCCMLAQWGLHVPCQEAWVCMNSQYLCDIGDGQSLSENLSTFSAHITNVLDILSRVNPESLVIMDELGSGTDPTEGMGIAIAILEALRESGCLFLVTTHYPEVKEYAEKTPGIINARMSFDKDTLKPTYQMVIGEAGESCAFYIASRLGMPNHMLRTAILAAYGEEAARVYPYQNQEVMAKEKKGDGISKMKKPGNTQTLASKYQRGDSVTVYPGKKIGIVCQPINEKGLLRVQMPDKKIWVSHKRVKLLVAAAELYPEGYDFSILFDTVANRKIRHDMERKYTENVLRYDGQ